MRQPLVAGNWKMNGTHASIRDWVGGIQNGIGGVTRARVAVCPPFVYLAEVAAAMRDSGITLGAQNCSHLSGGAYTGEVAPAMLKDVGCSYVIVGHSERRALYGESDQLVAEKMVAAHLAGLLPIVCVGELLEEREAGETEAVIARQLEPLLQHGAEQRAALRNAVIAYEPVWAIGTGKTATPAQAQEVHAFIRGRIAEQDAELAGRMQILYGGSVKGSNAAELFAMADIDGGLVGGASLNAAEFLAICRAA